ncbi:hypothetical protein A4G99_14515 [Haladaptatus sp. R4]|nr:hypothetical protein A4G99_14515 [Haladaptatus sp. R4]
MEPSVPTSETVETTAGQLEALADDRHKRDEDDSRRTYYPLDCSFHPSAKIVYRLRALVIAWVLGDSALTSTTVDIIS